MAIQITAVTCCSLRVFVFVQLDYIEVYFTVMASNSPVDVNIESGIALSSTQTLEFDDGTLRGKETEEGLILHECNL